MDIINCKMCGRIFRSTGGRICPKCSDDMDKMFLIVREYIEENPHANAMEVAEATEVDEDIILQFLREGRLSLKEASMGLPCERCGRPITTGRMCKDCIQEFDREMRKGITEAANNKIRKQLNSDRMYVADRVKKRK